MAELTPMKRQYYKIKEQSPDCILFFRLGDFYEMFDDDARLTEIGYMAGLISEERYKAFLRKQKNIAKIKTRLGEVLKPTEKLNNYLVSVGESPVSGGITINNLIRRSRVEPLDLKRKLGLFRSYTNAEVTTAMLDVKYEGYITRQKQLIDREKKLESKRLDPAFDYEAIKGLRVEAQQKLNAIKPLTIGQASRISGVNPADIAVLIIAFSGKKL